MSGGTKCIQTRTGKENLALLIEHVPKHCFADVYKRNNSSRENQLKTRCLESSEHRMDDGSTNF